MRLTGWKQLQEEHREWSLRNFGERPAWHPLLGIIEELGEFDEASDRESEEDAIADVFIFACDYAGAKGWDFADVVAEAEKLANEAGKALGPSFAMTTIGRIAHHELKLSQGIRGSAEEHDARGREGLAQLLSLFAPPPLRAAPSDLSDVLYLVDRTWEHVRKRDWKKDPVHAGGAS